MWKFRQLEPQPARGTLIETMWDSPDWIAEEKYDGDRRIAQFCGKVVRFTGRRKSVKDGLFVEKTENVPHLSGVWPAARHVEDRRVSMGKAPPASLDGTVLDGEMIVVPDLKLNGEFRRAQQEGMSKYVTSIMGSLPEEAVLKQIERGWLRYIVFDCLFYKGKDIRGWTLDDRRERVEQAVGEWDNPFVSVAEFAPASESRYFFKKILQRGGEGVILKRIDHVYGDKNGWVKVKAEWTADVVIIGYEDAKEESKKVDGTVSATKYAKEGLIGAVVIGQYRDGKMWRCSSPGKGVSGFSDHLRREFTADREAFASGARCATHVNQSVIEIAHNGREPTGRFRHPRFKRFRDDKSPKDCVYRDGEI